MPIISLSRAAAVGAALVVALFLSLAPGAAPAQADNCQPEEIVVRMIPGSEPDWQSVLADESDPRCVVAAQIGCPNQADPIACTNGIRATIAGRGPDCAYSAGLTNAVRAAVCKANYMLPYVAGP